MRLCKVWHLNWQARSSRDLPGAWLWKRCSSPSGLTVGPVEGLMGMMGDLDRAILSRLIFVVSGAPRAH